jgi:hypothetical protein
MTNDEIFSKHQKIRDGVKVAIARAIERHRRLGESIAVWKDGEVVVLSADRIPPLQNEDSQPQEYRHE